jgi:hypothetical protein
LLIFFYNTKVIIELESFKTLIKTTFDSTNILFVMHQKILFLLIPYLSWYILVYTWLVLVCQYFPCSSRHSFLQFVWLSLFLLHIHGSKNSKCAQEWRMIKVMTSPGNVVAGGAGGIRPCPPQQHQPPFGEYA